MSKFYTFDQNNSGGTFVVDKDKGLTHYVIIEADSYQDANERAEAIGIYFNGCEDDIDCPCCGDRWYRQWKGTDNDVPTVYGKPVVDGFDGYKWMADGENICVHYLDGSKKWF